MPQYSSIIKQNNLPSVMVKTNPCFLSNTFFSSLSKIYKIQAIHLMIFLLLLHFFSNSSTKFRKYRKFWTIPFSWFLLKIIANHTLLICLTRQRTKIFHFFLLLTCHIINKNIFSTLYYETEPILTISVKIRIKTFKMNKPMVLWL